jgi:2-polyprenyl-3-methyl-5-hydroxy-6-metoxy-1,4-benzoquinol methylase
MISERERDLYVEVWQSLDRYGTEGETFLPGMHFLPILLDLVGKERGSLLDAGCGNGMTGIAYQEAGFSVTLSDLTDAGLTEEARTLPFLPACLWQGFPARAILGGKYQIATCTDVLEHIPEQFTMLSVDQLLRVARRVFLTVRHIPDGYGAWVGEPLHKTVRPYTWWRDSLKEVGTLLEARDCIVNGVFFLEAR